MRISNIKIAEMIAERGYDYQEALNGIDAGRTPEQEGKEITKEDLEDMIKNICLSFEIEREERG